jgi:selenide,water dikinase
VDDAYTFGRIAATNTLSDVYAMGGEPLVAVNLLGHLFKLARASAVSAVIDHAAVPLIEGTRAAARAGHIPGGTRRNLQWVLPHTDTGAVGEEDLLLLADAQTSGGQLVAGELPGAAVIGELVARGDSLLIIG